MVIEGDEEEEEGEQANDAEMKASPCEDLSREEGGWALCRERSSSSLSHPLP